MVILLFLAAIEGHVHERKENKRKVYYATPSAMPPTFRPRFDSRPESVVAGKLYNVDIGNGMATCQELASIKEAESESRVPVVVDGVRCSTLVIGRREDGKSDRSADRSANRSDGKSGGRSDGRSSDRSHGRSRLGTDRGQTRNNRPKSQRTSAATRERKRGEVKVDS